MTEQQRWPDPAYLTKDHAINMTLRDYFAAKAMQAFLSRRESITCPDEVIAQDAYNAAEAMLKARDQ